MKYQKLKNKVVTSSWVLMTFVVITVIAGLASKLFQAPIFQEDQSVNIKSPIKVEYLANLESIELTNHFGTYKVVKNLKWDVSTWDLVTPKKLPASKEIIEKIIDAIDKIKVKKIIPYDEINADNFSLTNPVMSIKLEIADQSPITLSIGIVNSIDNTSYIYLGDKKYIYQIELMEHQLEAMVLRDFINPKVFSISKESIKQVTIIADPKTRKEILLQIKSDGSKWFNMYNSELSFEKVDTFVSELTGLTRNMILDEESDKLSKFIESNMKYPAFQIELEDLHGGKYLYLASQIIKKSSPEYKIDKKQVFMMTASDRLYPYLINKDALDLFSTRERDLRKR